MSKLLPICDDDLLAGFNDHSRPIEAFNHPGHLRVAWIFLQRFRLPDAINLVCSGIARFAAHVGAASKFHRTMTEALVRLMAHGGACDPALCWDDFLAANPQLVSAATQVLARYYSSAQLADSHAQHRFVLLDLRPPPI